MHPQPRAGSPVLLVGLPVFTSDGLEIGKVIGWAKHQGEHLLIAEIEQRLGIGSQPVAIPIDMFVQRADRIELTITAEQMADKLGRDLSANANSSAIVIGDDEARPSRCLLLERAQTPPLAWSARPANACRRSSPGPTPSRARRA